jgi:hypothetical protein
MQTLAFGQCCLAAMAAKNPAAPPPMMAIFGVLLISKFY